MILFLVALQQVLQQYTSVRPTGTCNPGFGVQSTCLPDDRNTLWHCRSDFITLAPDQTTSGIIAGLVLLVLVLDWVVMLFAHSVIRGAGALLQLFGVILGVTQVALGLRIIIISLAVWGYSSCRSNPGRVPDSVR